MHRRSLPKSVAQKVTNKLISRDYVVGVVQHENFPDIEGATRLYFPNTPARGVIALLKHAEGFIGIDSFIHHASLVFGTKGVVVWGGTNPKKLGYDSHINLAKEACKTPFCHRPDSYVFDATPIGSIWNCPHNTKCLDYDADEIITAYEKLIEGDKK
jgi:ADP-heptose:LPS heptosyltransferase